SSVSTVVILPTAAVWPAGWRRNSTIIRLDGMDGSAHHRGALVVEPPAGDQVLHRLGVVACAQRLVLVEPMRCLDLRHVDLDTETRPVGNGNCATDDLQGLLGQALTVLPDPVGGDSGDLSRRGGGDGREHRKRDVEVIVGVGPPGQAPIAAHLGDPDRTSIVQKCGSASGMSTAWSWIACSISRQSVATMFVAVGSPVARRKSAITSRPEKPFSAQQGSSA